jgi:hypothetical protein
MSLNRNTSDNRGIDNLGFANTKEKLLRATLLLPPPPKHRISGKALFPWHDWIPSTEEGRTIFAALTKN